MNYRERQVRKMWADDLHQKSQAWSQERHQFQQDIFNLQNSTDAKILENLEKENKKKQQTINNLVNALGSEDIKSLVDLTNLLGGRTLKELISQSEQKLAAANQSRERRRERLNLKEQKISELETNLLNLAKQKLNNKREAKLLVEKLETQWQEKQANWETQTQQQQETFARELSQTKAEQAEEIKSLKQKALQEKNQAIEQAQQQGEVKLKELQENLESQISSLELKLEVGQREIQTHQHTINHLNKQTLSQQENITNLNRTNQRAKETNQTSQQRISQLETYLKTSQQDSQTTIQNLNQDKVNLQQQIANLTQAQTEQTKKVTEQAETLTNQEQTITELTNRKQALTETILIKTQKISQLEGLLETARQGSVKRRVASVERTDD